MATTSKIALSLGALMAGLALGMLVPLQLTAIATFAAVISLCNGYSKGYSP